MDIRGKAVLITGAGSGIGQAAAVALARQGARLALTGRRRAPLEKTQHLVEAEDGEAFGLPGDVTDAEWRDQTIDIVREHSVGSISSSTSRAS